MKATNFTIFVSLLLTYSWLAIPAHAAEQIEVRYADLEWRDDVFSLAGKPFTGIARDTHKDGKPKALYPFSEGRLHGVVREWWDNGQISTETHFEKGLRHGLNRYWSRTGQLMKEQI